MHREVQCNHHKPHSWLSPYARRLPSVHRSVSAHALGHPNPNCIGIPRCLHTTGDTSAMLVKCSLQTFLDALSCPDRTC
eukprot:scaffold45509_cov69-Phaeocystis_antarctica.AAC.4